MMQRQIMTAIFGVMLLALPLSSSLAESKPAMESRNVPEKLAIDRQGVKVWTYQIDGNPSFNYRAHTVLNSNLVGAVAAIMDTSYLSEWVPHTSRVEMLSRDDQAGTFTLLMEIKFPFPLKNRDVVVAGTIKQQPDGSVLIQNKAAVDPHAPVRPEFIRITRYEGSWLVRQLDAKRTEVTTTGYADPAGSLPNAIVNMFVQQQPYQMLKNMQIVVNSPRYQKAKLVNIQNPTF